MHWGCYYATALDIEVDPQRCCLGSCQSDFALQAVVECRALETDGTREEPGTLTQGAPVFPGSSRLGIEPKTPGWLVQDPTPRPIGDLIPTIGGSGALPGRGWDP